MIALSRTRLISMTQYRRTNSKHFPSLKPVKRFCVKGKEVIIQPDRSLFARLLVIREKTGISIRVQLRHSLGPVAWSLATPEGCIYKSVESKLLNAIEERIKTVDEIPSKSAIIYDGIIHQLPKYLETFRDLSWYLLFVMSKIKSIDYSILEFSDAVVTKILLFRDSDSCNTLILNSAIVKSYLLKDLMTPF